MDKNRSICLVYDACINSNPFNDGLKDADFQLFLIELAVEWVEEKEGLKLSRQFTIPKMLSKSKLVPHVIKRAKRPVIAEVDALDKNMKGKSVESSAKTIGKDTVKIVKKKIPEKPEYFIIAEPAQNPEYLALEIQLPLLTTISSSTLDVEPRRLLFSSDEYELDIALPNGVNVDEVGAQFDFATRRLHVTMATAATDTK